MRAETVIATHANTDFDAFASMLAVRHLYPGAVVCLYAPDVVRICAAAGAGNPVSFTVGGKVDRQLLTE